MNIRLYMLQPSTGALGPGSRFAIWTQGCERRCPDCISPKSRSFDGGEVRDTVDLARQVAETPGIEGLTVSGGEPFLQAKALCELIETVKNSRDLGVIIYTGYVLQELLDSDIPDAKKLLGLCDLLIDGPYKEEYNDGKSLRGSSNQKIIPLTERYREYLEAYGTEGRNIEVIVRENGKVRIVGIPPRDIRNYVALE
jgi:anaerobic ribonucleoside-triphosphate reductase activating protein